MKKIMLTIATLALLTSSAFASYTGRVQIKAVDAKATILTTASDIIPAILDKSHRNMHWDIRENCQNSFSAKVIAKKIKVTVNEFYALVGTDLMPKNSGTISYYVKCQARRDR